VLGVISVADPIKDDSAFAIGKIKDMGIRVVMLTGDNRIVAKNVGASVGIDEVISELHPEDKEDAVRKLSESGPVIMVGDGINDAPALARASVGMAIGCGTDIAIGSEDVVLVNSRLSDVAFAVELSRGTLRNIRENLFFAFVYNVIGIPLAAGAFIPLFGWELDPMFGALAMSLSSFSVVMNALRLNWKFKRKRNEKDREEIKIMKKTMKVKGMMCPHCEARVKSALEAIVGVSSAEVSHKKGSCVISLNSEVANELLVAAVTEAGYKVISVE
jgi:Cu2+-exporting ATPase